MFAIARDHTGGSAYETRVTLNLHTGTHAMRPFISGGREHHREDGVDRLITRCRVLDLSGMDRITRPDLESQPIGDNDFLILKTGIPDRC